MENTEELWRAAVGDSGIDPSRLHRFNALRSTVEGVGAQWWAPGISVREPPLELSQTDTAAGDTPPLVEKHRVATLPIDGLEPAVAEGAFAAKLRHELEHARQWEACGPDPFALMRLARLAPGRKMGGTIYARSLIRCRSRTTQTRQHRSSSPESDRIRLTA